jgi:hypothetical protein
MGKAGENGHTEWALIESWRLPDCGLGRTGESLSLAHGSVGGDKQAPLVEAMYLIGTCMA